MKYLLFSLILLSCATTKETIRIPVTSYTLENGLRVLLIKNNRLPIAHIRMYYNIGAKNEAADTSGSSHFLEHMMFKGSKSYPEGSFDQLLEAVGGDNNAYTNFDSTVYYEDLPAHFIPKMLEMEADRMTHLELGEKSFENERNVVFEERKMRYENSAPGKLYLELVQAVFQGTPYEGSVIGSVEDLKNLTREKMIGYYRDYYAPNNAILVIAGDFNENVVKEEVRKNFAGLKKSEKVEEKKKIITKETVFPLNFKGIIDKKINGQTQNILFMMGFKGKPITSLEGFGLDLLSNIIGESESSALVQEFVKGQNPILSSVYSSNYTLQNAGTFFIGGELLPSTNLDNFKTKLQEKLKDICETAINEKTLQTAKNQMLISYFDKLSKNAGKASFIGDRENFFNDHLFYKKEISFYQNVKKEEIKEVCQKTINLSNFVFIAISDKF